MTLASLPFARRSIAQGTPRRARRSIRPHAIDMRFDYDAVERSRGANRHFQDRASRKYLRLELAADAYRRVKRPSNIDVVVFENGDVVTAARLTRRFRRA